MQQHLAKWLQALADLSEAMQDPPPTKKEQEAAASALKKSEDANALEAKKLAENTRRQASLAASIPLLENALKELKAGTTPDAGPASANVQQQYAKMEELLGKLKEEEEKARTDKEKGAIDSNRLGREVNKALDHYYRTANPLTIAQHDGVTMEINHGFNANTDYKHLTKVGDTEPWVRQHFGLAAEHTWDDYYFASSKIINLTAISQHEQVTADIISDTANKLLRERVPGITVPVGRVAMTVYEDGWPEHKPQTFSAIFGHPEPDFRPSVVNNSTKAGWDYSAKAGASVHKTEAFHTEVGRFVKGEGTKTMQADNGTVTYGLPPLGLPILTNASGNDDWGHAPNPTITQNFYPFHMNIGASAFPARKDEVRRDETAPSHVEEYSTTNSAVHAIVSRPRWNEDGTALKTRYLHPDFEKRVEDNLWRLTGRSGTPTKVDLDTAPVPLVQALEATKKSLIEDIKTRKGVDAQGLSSNLRGTSFAAPTAGGILLAARTLYPKASESEVVDAFCSSCTPIIHRERSDKSVQDDILYVVDKNTGYTYSPKVGFGEFVIDPKATKEKPDSWHKMLGRLEEMQQKRAEITQNGRQTTTRKIGEGADAREVTINGQPLPVTIELNKMQELNTEANAKTAQEQEDRIRKAFMKVGETIPLPPPPWVQAVDPANPIEDKLKKREYGVALKELKRILGYKDSHFMFTADNKHLPPNTMVALEEVVKEVNRARDMREHTYSLTVHENQDICCNLAALRLKFKDASETDKAVVLESPDGLRLPVNMSDPLDGIRIGSTPGFMRKSAAGIKSDGSTESAGGTWKIYTRDPLDVSDSQLMLYGTERNIRAGIVDVREMVLPEIEKQENKPATLAEKNIAAPLNPHQYLRQINDVAEPTPAAQPKQVPVVAPYTWEEDQQRMQDIIDKSELKKGGFIPDGKFGKISQDQAKEKPKNVLDAISDTLKKFMSAAPEQPATQHFPMEDVALDTLASPLASLPKNPQQNGTAPKKIGIA